MGKRKGDKIPEVLTDQEQQDILSIPNIRYPTGERNKTMINLMLDVGLRREEVVSLRWRDLDLITGKLMVRESKGAKDRSLWVRDETLEALQAWRERQAAIVEAPEYVFSSISKGAEGKKMNKQYLYYMVKRIAKRAGITKDISPHTFRHTFAVDLYKETKNLKLVQTALGHSSISTTQIYTHVIDDELEDALKMFRNSKNKKGEK